MKKKKTKQNVELTFFVLISLIFLTIFYSGDTRAAAGNVCDSNSPCACGSTCQDGGSEPESATIDTCEDGYDHDLEYVHDLNITDLDSSTFDGGDTVRVTGIFKCSSYGDYISLAYNNGTDGENSWRHVYSPGSKCSNSATLQVYSVDITLDNVGGTHSVRAMIGWAGNFGLTCGYDGDEDYSDSDDISFTVIAGSGPSITVENLTTPGNATATTDTTLDFNFSATTLNSISNCSIYTNSGGWSIKKSIFNVTNNTINNFTLTLTEGSYIWNVYCYDNETSYDYYDQNYTVSVDLTNPTISLSTPSNNTYQNTSTLTVNLNHNDANPGNIILNVDSVNRTIQTYSGASSEISYAGLSDGAHTYKVFINDSAGHYNVSETRTINIDTTNPSVFDLVSPANEAQGTTSQSLSPLFDWEDVTETNFSNYTIQISTDNTFSNVNYTRYSYNVVTNSSYQFDDTLANNLTWYWRVIAYDLASNYRISTNTYSYITNTSNLVVYLTSPQNNFANVSAPVTFKYTPEGSNFDTCSLWGNFSGSFVKNQTNTSAIITGQVSSFSPITLIDGVYLWNVECNTTDNSSTFALNNYTLYIDSVSPTIDFVANTPENYSNLTSRTVVINVTHSENNPSKLVLNWNGTNETYSYNGPNTTITKTNLADGSYSFYVFVNDTARNTNITETRVFTIDATPPIIINENVSPSYGTNLTMFNITANITDVLEINSFVEISYPNSTKINFSMINSSNIWYYEFNSSVEGTYNATIYSNDTLGNINYSGSLEFFIDLSAPKYQNISELEDPLSGNIDQVIRINVSDSLTDIDTVLINYNGINYSMVLESINVYNYSINVSTLGMKNYSFFMNNTLGFVNTTLTYNFTINDTTKPQINLITYLPTALDDIDPNVAVNVSANITDRYSIDTAILQYKEINSTIWNNVTMNYTNGFYTGNFTPDTENNWTFRIIANDTTNNINISDNTTIESFYDWSWIRSPVSWAPKGATPNQLVTLGTITIENTGDFDLRFDLSNSADQPSVAYNETDPFTISAKQTKQIVATTIAPGLIGQYDIGILIDALNSSASPTMNYTNVTLVVSEIGSDNIFAYISQHDPSVEQGQSGINLTMRIMNLGGATAYNVTSNWTIPSDFDTRDSLVLYFDNITASGSEYHSIIVGVSPTANLTTSAEIAVWANSSTGSFSTDSKYVSINEPGTTSTPTAPSGGSSGGGSSTTVSGGGGGPTTYKVPNYETVIKSQENLEVIRGTTKNFIVTVMNDEFATTLENINLEVNGFKPGYIRVQGDQKNSIGYKESKQFTLVVEVPKYMRESKHELELVMFATGKSIYEDETLTKIVKNSKKINLIVHEVSEEDILCVDTLQASIDEMIEKDFNVISFKKIFNEAKLARKNKDFKGAQDLCDEFNDLKENANDAYSKIFLLKETIANSKKQGFDMSSAEKILDLAIDTFNRGNFDKAIERLREAELTIGVKKGEQFAQIKSFFITHWLLVLVSSVLISGSSVGLYKVNEYKRIKITIGNLKKQEKSIFESIKKTQTNFFVNKLIGDTLYYSYMQKYREKMADIQHKLIELDIKKSKMFRRDKTNSLKYEAEKLMGIIENLQKNYFEKKIIDKQSYKKMFYFYKKKFADLQKKLLEQDIVIEHTKKELKQEISDPRSYFYMHNGDILKNLDELLEALRNSSNDTFKFHVHEGKNDFSDWIKNVLKNDDLAEEISKENDKKNIISILDIHLSKYKK
jgi:hypothetical protein